MNKFNILSLDGGGTWAVIQAMALGALYGIDTPGHQILKNFNLVVANSGGSIVAGGLFANATPGQLIKEFKSRSMRKSVFRARPFYKQATRLVGFGPKYRAHRKRDALKHIFAKYDPHLTARPIDEVPNDFGRADRTLTHLLVIAFDYEYNKPAFFRSNRSSLAGTQKAEHKASATLADAVHASTNAPVNYFDEPAAIAHRGSERRMWDGAIAGYNNPILAGITEALANGVDRSSIQVLSLGTAARVLPRTGSQTVEHPWLSAEPYRPKFLRLVGDIEKLARSIVENPPEVATYMAFFMITELAARSVHLRDQQNLDLRIIRLNPLMQPTRNSKTEKFDTPAAGTAYEKLFRDRDFRKILKLDLDAVRASDVDLICRFADLWLEDYIYNQPILFDPKSLDCQIGHRWFSDGRAHAIALGLAPADEALYQDPTGGSSNPAILRDAASR
jgi:hypothetical protein